MKDIIFSIIRKIEFIFENGKQLKSKKRIFLACVQSHGNLGDQAITVATEKFLKKYLDKYEIVELTTSNILDDYIFDSISFNSDDILIIQGGGFLGNLWDDIYCATIKIIKKFKNNKIIIFPQSYSYTRDEIGDKKAKADASLFKKCKDLSIFARDKISYQIFTEKYDDFSNIHLCPDIVFTLDMKIESSSINNKTLLMIRKDKEGNMDIDSIISILNTKKITYDTSDTIVNGRINKTNRLKKIYNKLSEIKSYDLVITDRLHGMIFSYITNTPCIVFANNNHKVEGTYLWISKKDNIIFIKDLNDLSFAMDNISKNTGKKIDLSGKYKELIKIIKE